LNQQKTKTWQSTFCATQVFDEIWERFERKSEKPLNTLPATNQNSNQQQGSVKHEATTNPRSGPDQS
jgi:hypothetical protein